MKQGTFLNPQHLNEQETYEIKLYKRVRGNSAYVYENAPILVFRARPATQMETKLYRITKGVNSSTNGITLYCSNLPNEVEVEDRVEFMGKIMLVKNIGFFYNHRCTSLHNDSQTCFFYHFFIIHIISYGYYFFFRYFQYIN